VKTDIEILFYHFREQIPAHKSKKFLEWFKEQYPHLDGHHILGSPFGQKSTDYLLAPIEHFEHIEKAHKNLEAYFETHLVTAVKILINYVKFLEEKKEKK